MGDMDVVYGNWRITSYITGYNGELFDSPELRVHSVYSSVLIDAYKSSKNTVKIEEQVALNTWKTIWTA